MTLVGKTIGHIRIMDILGQGGMGKVYVGFDETLERKVALKAIHVKPRLKSQAKARFLREARALSQLEHPNICQIHDYIEGKESDFLVLEFIEGNSLNQEIAKRPNKSLKLKIAEQIAKVLVAAHEKGIVHRDLKPSNIMLTKEDEVKVLDFGLARFVDPRQAYLEQKTKSKSVPLEPSLDHPAEVKDKTITLSQPLSDKDFLSDQPEDLSEALKTKRGTVMGTPMYMSPEQARGEPVSAASDMFSFGLILQELFSGQPPYEDDIDYTTLLEKAMKGESRPVTGVSSDLTTLINRLKFPAPTARPSAVETTEWLQRIREKPKRRIRRLVAAGIVAAFILVGFKYTLDLRRERALALVARDQAEQARDEVVSVVKFLVDLFEVSDPGEARGNTITAREILSKGAEEITQGLQKQPLTQARLMDTIGIVYSKLGLYKDSAPLLKKALEIREKLLGIEDTQVAESLISLAILYEQQGKFEKAKQISNRSLEIREKALTPDHPDIAASLHRLARIHHKQGALDEALPLYKRSLEIREKTLGPNHPDVAESLRDLGILYYMKAQYSEAESLYKRALTIRETILGPDHPDVGRNLNSLAALYFTQGRYDEAEPLYKRALAIREKTLGSVHPEVAICLNNLALLYYYQNKFSEAETLYMQALEIRENTLGESHPDVAESLDALAVLYHEQGKYGEAEPLYKQAIKIKEKTFGPDHQEVAKSLSNLAILYSDQNKLDKAETLHKQALKIREKALGPNHPDTAESLNNIAFICLADERYDEAEKYFKRALVIQENVFGPDHLHVADILDNLSHISDEKGQFNEAEKLLQRALAIREKQPDSNNAALANTLHNLANIYFRRLNQPDKAELCLKRALAIREKVLSPDNPEMIETLKDYVDLFRSQGRENEAVKLETRIKAASKKKTQKKI